MLDKNGDPIKAFICAYRKPFEYLVLLDSSGNIRKSVYPEDEHDLIKIKQDNHSSFQNLMSLSLQLGHFELFQNKLYGELAKINSSFI